MPDLAFLGYLAGPRVGAIAYNLTHSLLGPGLLALAALRVPAVGAALPVALVWIVHIGIDRALNMARASALPISAVSARPRAQAGKAEARMPHTKRTKC